jgi:hypothetical protein
MTCGVQHTVWQGASWNRTLWREMAAVTGKELRALWVADIGEVSPPLL